MADDMRFKFWQQLNKTRYVSCVNKDDPAEQQCNLCSLLF